MKLPKSFFKLILNAALKTINYDGIEHAGYMAFMNLLSLFPFLVFVLALTGFAGNSAFGVEFIEIIVSNLSAELILPLKPRIQEIMQGAPQSLLTLSVLGAVWTASSSVEGLRTILNRVYNVKAPPAYILRRLLSIAQFLFLTLFLLLAVLILVFLPSIYTNILSMIHIDEHIKQAMYFDFSLANPKWASLRFILLFFSLYIVTLFILYVIPNIKIPLKSLLPGAAIIVFGWLGCGYLLKLYYSNVEQINLIYGSLGSIIMSMLFFFFFNLIFIFGATFNAELLHLKRRKYQNGN